MHFLNRFRGFKVAQTFMRMICQTISYLFFCLPAVKARCLKTAQSVLADPNHPIHRNLAAPTFIMPKNKINRLKTSFVPAAVGGFKGLNVIVRVYSLFLSLFLVDFYCKGCVLVSKHSPPCHFGHCFSN